MWKGFVGAPLDGPLSPPTNEGDGQQMAMKAGGRLAGTKDVWWMPGIDVGSETYDGRRRLRMGAAGKSLPGAIAVNSAGRRFANESMNYDDFGKYMAAFDPHSFTFPNFPAFVVTDSQHRERYPPIAYDAGRHENEDWLVAAPTLGALASTLGIDADGLEAGVAQFNEYAAGGEDPEFFRGQLAHDRSGKFGDKSRTNPNLAPLTQPPYYGYVLRAACLGTKGGAATDERGRVLDHADSPIAGLYAAGNAAAPVFGAGYPGGGATIAAALVFGYAVGREVTGADPVGPSGSADSTPTSQPAAI
jgi:3-oxosteroid 1-dehydrogenase